MVVLAVTVVESETGVCEVGLGSGVLLLMEGG